MNKSYDDIINLERPVSLKHPKMTNYDRAAQFSPFAALTGYEEKVSESGRITDSKIELTEEEKTRIDAVLSELEDGDLVKVIYFQPDSSKSGGEYLEIVRDFRKIDSIERTIEFGDRSRISLDSLREIFRIN